MNPDRTGRTWVIRLAAVLILIAAMEMWRKWGMVRMFALSIILGAVAAICIIAALQLAFGPVGFIPGMLVGGLCQPVALVVLMRFTP